MRSRICLACIAFARCGDPSGSDRYNAACIAAKCSAAVPKEDAETHAVQAIEWLKAAHAAGYFVQTKADRISWMDQDADLNAIRNHPAYEKFRNSLPAVAEIPARE